ncbi:glutamic acid-rich protein-like [Belonocnema kinseyi]|uniref:glutamic acid-rich protein-like n=1 Tax=Belonocnema kinseyi TaxID=2817044 RepID=UPI00143DAEC6|nr:glutamic acid-rich protein-like [Belonocnema kinseyi]
MSECLPFGGFEWVLDQDINVQNIPDDLPIGYIYEVDLEYPTELHDFHRDLPLAPEHFVPPNSSFFGISAVVQRLGCCYIFKKIDREDLPQLVRDSFESNSEGEDNEIVVVFTKKQAHDVVEETSDEEITVLYVKEKEKDDENESGEEKDVQEEGAKEKEKDDEDKTGEEKDVQEKSVKEKRVQEEGAKENEKDDEDESVEEKDFQEESVKKKDAEESD